MQNVTYIIFYAMLRNRSQTTRCRCSAGTLNRTRSSTRCCRHPRLRRALDLLRWIFTGWDIQPLHIGYSNRRNSHNNNNSSNNNNNNKWKTNQMMKPKFWEVTEVHLTIQKFDFIFLKKIEAFSFLIEFSNVKFNHKMFSLQCSLSWL